MSHTYEKVSGNKAKLTFTIPAEQFDEALQKTFLKLRNRINVPGFRRGKAPRKMIETLYGESVFYDDALELLFPDAYDEAVKEYDLHPVDQPEVSVDEIGAGKDLKFHLEVFVKPDVTLGEYKNLTVEATMQKLTDEMVDARIEQDREKASRTVDVDDRPVQEGDTVNLDYAGTVDGVAFEGGTAKGSTLTIGSHQFIPGFEEQMIGMAIGEEKDLPVKFPEEYHAEELKGKDAVFHVKVNSITKTEKPELDDDFAADISEFDTFADYKANVVKELTEQVEKNNDIAAENAVVAKAVENAQLDVPDAMVRDQANYMLREMDAQMRQQGFSLEDYIKWTGQTPQSVAETQKPEALRRVKTELVLEAIIKAEKIEPDEEAVEKAIAEQAERLNEDVAAFKARLTDEQKEYLKDNAAIRIAVDMMKNSATVTEKKPEEEKKDEAEEKTEAKTEKKARAPRKTAKKADAEESKAEEPAEDAGEEKPAEKKPRARKTAKKTEDAE